ncbi:FecR domain-containing protein [Mesorhizobium sp. SB112]|uniref:FecR family protein n=1 Tax=Mesorhizobium sp. SB112 TaxID=3151853 RepID=UPI00326667B2
MNEPRHDDEQLFLEALDLVTRLQADPASSVAQDLIASWRSRSATHDMAWLEVAEIHGMAGALLGNEKKAKRSGILSRRGVILGGAATIAAAGTGFLFGPEALIHVRADYLTSTSEFHEIDLQDGSRVTLGPDSALRVAFGDATRRVELMAGMAFFDVAKDYARPFQVIADRLETTATGTAFDVSRDSDFLTVSVRSGAVDAKIAESSAHTVERLSEGEWATLQFGTDVFERGARDVEQIGAWRDGLIFADREAIASLVAKIRRWHDGRIVIASASFGEQRISGVFDLNKPMAALEAVVQPYGGKVRQISPWLTVVSAI